MYTYDNLTADFYAFIENLEMQKYIYKVQRYVKYSKHSLEDLLDETNSYSGFIFLIIPIRISICINICIPVVSWRCLIIIFKQPFQ